MCHISCKLYLSLIYEYAVVFALCYSPLALQFHKRSISLAASKSAQTVTLWYVLLCLYVALYYVTLLSSLREQNRALCSKSDTCSAPVHFLRLPSSSVSYRPDYLSPYFDVIPISMIRQLWAMSVSSRTSELNRIVCKDGTLHVEWKPRTIQINLSHIKSNLPVPSRFIAVISSTFRKVKEMFLMLAFSMCRILNSHWILNNLQN